MDSRLPCSLLTPNDVDENNANTQRLKPRGSGLKRSYIVDPSGGCAGKEFEIWEQSPELCREGFMEEEPDV